MPLFEGEIIDRGYFDISTYLRCFFNQPKDRVIGNISDIVPKEPFRGYCRAFQEGFDRVVIKPLCTETGLAKKAESFEKVFRGQLMLSQNSSRTFMTKTTLRPMIGRSFTFRS